MNDLSMRSPIRVALRVADGPSAAYLATAADAVMQVPGVKVILILASGHALDRTPASRRLRHWCEAAYDWCERRVLRGGPDALDARQPMPWPAGVEVVRGATLAEQVGALLAAQAEVLIDLVPDQGLDVLPVPPGGRWRLRYSVDVGGMRQPGLGRPRRASSGLGESLLSMELGSGVVQETGIGVSALRRIGYVRDRNAVYWRSSLLPARRLARLAAGEAVPSAGDVPGLLSGEPGSGEPKWDAPPFIGLAITVVGKVVERILFRTGWTVIIRSRELGQEPPGDLSGFRTVEAPPGRFYADPFVVAADDGTRLLVEDCPDGSHRGRISVLRMASDGRWVHERVALDDLEHRAYPHALTTDAGLLITPDSGRSGGVDLFLDRGARAGLERIGRGLEGTAASDPTLLWHDGRYWLFVTVTGHGMSPWDELHLYSAGTPDGQWHPHPRNPVVADVRRARPAGRIFRRGDVFDQTRAGLLHRLREADRPERHYCPDANPVRGGTSGVHRTSGDARRATHPHLFI